MNVKRFALAGLAAFITFQALDFVIHGLLLSKTYESLMSIWRPDMMSVMWVMYVSSFIMSFIMAYIFIIGYEGKGIYEGLRFGFIIGLFMQVPAAMNQYAVYPIPASLAVQWFIFGMIEFLVVGIVISLVYKPLNA